jgi:hypothetical protein
MAFRNFIESLQRTGREEDAMFANLVDAQLRRRGKDISQSPEAGGERYRFTPEQKTALEGKGFLIYPLTGQSVATLRAAGHPFWSVWHKGELFETIQSHRTEVAIDPTRLALPKSNRGTMEEQFAMVMAYGREMRRDVTGTAALLGNVADYAELAFAHLAAKGQRLFGEDFGFDYARTATSTDGDRFALVGKFSNDCLGIDTLDRRNTRESVWAVPLVVPASAVDR